MSHFDVTEDQILMDFGVGFVEIEVMWWVITPKMILMSSAAVAMVVAWVGDDHPA
jgi:hypothetical protein